VRAILLAPIAVPLALLAGLLRGSKTADWTAAEVAEVLRNFLTGKGGDWDRDDFESVPITDPALDRIRMEAAKAGPPEPDLVKLADLLRQAEELSKAAHLREQT
jgi:hypothetical protein